MSKSQFVLGIILASVFGGLVALGTYKALNKNDNRYNSSSPFDTFDSAQHNSGFANYLADSNIAVPKGLNFVVAAKLVTPGVVYIRTVIKGSESSSDDPFHQMFPEFFNQPDKPRSQLAAGSGVIISPDGYIATNYHVVENAEKLQITLNDNRRYTPKIIGVDPNTDLALLKIDEKNLPYVRFGSSDNLQIGEWVLAIGNPFELTSTVTAGIVSAKARNINILHRQEGVESFIQTDAVVNPGNSGGALVNLSGELVGINTAIATPTGTYAGYSFAVPASLVQKVMDDLAKFGSVQRAFLGISIQDVDADFAEQHKIKEHSGVYVAEVRSGTAAEAAGLKEGDIITKIDETPVENVSELQETVARKHPGDQVSITFIRDDKLMTARTILKNFAGDVSIVKKESSVEIDGALFSNIPDDLKQKLNINGGVQLKEIKSRKWKDAGIKEGFIITYVDKKPISSLDDLSNSLSAENGRFFIEGVYPNGEEDYYRISK
jgi:serine protease Do